MKKISIFFLIFLSKVLFANGFFINPITDVCWDCIFPITISGINVTPGYEDLSNNSSKKFCFCSGTPPKAGLPITFWEPARMVEVTRQAYKLIGLGGISLGKDSVKNRGSIGLVTSSESKQSFYHVHWYYFPILAWLKLFTDLPGLEEGELDLVYLSEFDIGWNDDQYSFLINPESSLFSSPVAQLACIADCAASSADKPIDSLFWCAGCQGSLYPFTGTVAHHVGPIQASSLLVHRMIARLHRMRLLKGFADDNFCQAEYMPIIKKSLYKTQMVYPIAQSQGPCHALGKTDLLYGSGKSFPVDGEDFVYLIWIKKHCCLDAIKPITKFLIGN